MSPIRSVLLAALAALLCAPAAADAALPLLGQWPLDASTIEGNNQVTPDTSGNGLHLRAPNGAIQLGPPAHFGTGATLPAGVTPMQVTSPLLAPAQVTVLAWISHTGNPGTRRFIAGWGDDGLSCGGSSYALHSGSPLNPGLHFSVRLVGGGSALTAAAEDGDVFDGQWHLVAGTFDGSAARLYVDGVLVGAPIPANAPINYALNGGGSFFVDGYPVAGCAGAPNDDDWPGPIDEVRVYDRALTAPELGRLAAAAGPAAPDLVTDAAFVPPVVLPTGPPPSLTANATPVVKGVEVGKLAAATAGIIGASKKPLNPALQSALGAARDKGLALQALKGEQSASQVGAAQAVKEVTAKQANAVRPDRKIQDRLKAMKFGVTAQVPAASSGDVVEAVATLVLEKKTKAGKLTTQTIVLPPAVGIAGAMGGGNLVTPVHFPVDLKALQAMSKPDVVKAGIEIQAALLKSAGDGLSEMGETESLRLQMAMDRVSKFMQALSNIEKKFSDVSQQITQNIKGFVAKSGHFKKPTLAQQAAKLDKQAAAAERSRDEANQEAKEVLRPFVATLIDGLTSTQTQLPGTSTPGTLPTAATSLSGCTLCKLAAIEPK